MKNQILNVLTLVAVIFVMIFIVKESGSNDPDSFTSSRESTKIFEQFDADSAGTREETDKVTNQLNGYLLKIISPVIEFFKFVGGILGDLLGVT